ncbi:MAG: hypothetical protein IJK46_08615 [Prevotella sp.]|nr:hypothetical protein [Prevotella sp.]MBQ6728673.1 hypothetical protein [Bacteroidales bacterium]
MNIKLHTPKSLKTGSGMSSMKQFLLSLLATTVSIALTFGTAAIIDYNKKQGEKREIVMMVMYDMCNSLNLTEKVDSSILQSMEIQRQIAEAPANFDALKFKMAQFTSTTMETYTETTERIFSSSIETINTVGNVLFTENVADFYQKRKFYKTTVCDSLLNVIIRKNALSTLKGALDVDYSLYAMVSRGVLNDMKRLYAQSKQMMEVTDEEIDAYRKQRNQIDNSMSEKEAVDSVLNNINQLQEKIEESKAKLK